MLIRYFIVTYRNPQLLENCLRSILSEPGVPGLGRQIFVIGNHSSDALPDGLDIPPDGTELTLLPNFLRPDFSTGHLSRSWNQALINGFENLDAPACDLVVCAQVDTEFAPGHLLKLFQLHETYDLITYGAGDACVSYSAVAVKTVGLWDERFCNIGYQEADYFLRAAKLLGDRVSINDRFHRRFHYPIEWGAVLKDTQTGYDRVDPAHHASRVHHNQSRLIFQTKWGIDPDNWSGAHLAAEPLIDSYVHYPYFERAVTTLEQQRYVVPD